MKKAIVIHVTIYDEDTNCIEEQFIEHYDGSFGYEVENLFERLGEKFAPMIDRYHPERPA